MSFTRIITEESGRTTTHDVEVPEDIRLSEEERAARVLAQKDIDRRAAVFQELTPVNRIQHAPVELDPADVGGILPVSEENPLPTPETSEVTGSMGTQHEDPNYTKPVTQIPSAPDDATDPAVKTGKPKEKR